MKDSEEYAKLSTQKASENYDGGNDFAQLYTKKNDAHFARVDLELNLYTADSNGVNEEASISNDDVASDMTHSCDQIPISLRNI